jgi:hypothetical protein
MKAGFLALAAECEEVKALAKDRLMRSGVSNAATGRREYSEIRTSSGMSFTRKELPLIERIERRVAAWTLLPPENAESMQVLKYEVRPQERAAVRQGTADRPDFLPCGLAGCTHSNAQGRHCLHEAVCR